MVAATPLSAQPRGDEPVAVPRTIKQGIDFTYVDPQMSTVARRKQRPQNWLARMFNLDFGGRIDLNASEAEQGRDELSAKRSRRLKEGADNGRVAHLSTRLP